MVDLEFGQIIISSMHANVNCTITKKEKNRHRKAGLKKLLIINNNLKNIVLKLTITNLQMQYSASIKKHRGKGNLQ
jgi:hypothetical protein